MLVGSECYINQLEREEIFLLRISMFVFRKRTVRQPEKPACVGEGEMAERWQEKTGLLRSYR